MKILMVTSIPPDLDKITGGVESVSVNLLHGFSKIDVELNVISFRREVKKETVFEFSPNIKIYYYPFSYIKSTKLFLLLFGSHIVKRHAKMWKPDIIHLQGNGTSLLQLIRLKNKNVIITPHGDQKGEHINLTGSRKRIKQKISILIDYLLLRRINNFIFISEYLKKSLFDNNFLDKVKFQAIIFNPVNPIFFNVKDNEIKNRLNIIYVGQISKRKGLINLIKSLGELKGKGILYNLNVVGDFSDKTYKELILSAVKEYKLDSQIKFSGWLPQQQIAELLDDNGIFVLPSNQESLPVSIIESMSGGRLVIATDVGGIPEIIMNDQTGYVYKKNDIRQLSTILETLFHNSERYLLISNNARKFAKNNFSSLTVAEKTKNIYSEVINYYA